MILQRMENVGIVFEDPAAAVAFFGELGLVLEGEMVVEGSWGDDVIGLDDARENSDRLCSLRGPEGIIVALAEPLN